MTVIPLPTPPEPRTPSGFPWAATVAPVIASLAIWMLTRSPFALLFALLGPVVAVASLADNRWHGRRRRRKEQRRFDREAEVVRAEIAAAHVAERAALDAEFPSTRALIERGDLDRWHGPDPDRLFLGRGRMPSRLALRGDDARRHPLSRTGTVLAELRALAAHVDDGVVTVDTADGLAFVGVGPAPAAAARSVVLRLAGALDPAVWSVGVHPPAAADDGWRWVGFLPHARSVTEHAGSRAGPATPLTAPLGARRREGVRIDFRRYPTGAGGPPTTRSIAVVDRMDGVPRLCRTAVVFHSGGARVRPVGTAGGPSASSAARSGGLAVRPEFVTIDDAGTAAAALTAAAVRAGIIAVDVHLPDVVPLDRLENARAVERRPAAAGLAAQLGLTPSGPWEPDLVRDGPHAVVGGTTGSGKSELLTTWIAAIALRHPPSEVTFLLVDFKGGAAFGAVAGLPHSVGLVTDLDQSGARRALESLRAEVRYRERELAAARARSVDELPSGVLPRLVIVVDEFAALGADFPDLHALFADLAARGRSLGVHLVLCTQRPGASVRDAILANCTLRICLRVNDPADSLALLGTPAAASLPRSARGRAFVSVGGEEAHQVQVAITGPGSIAAVTAVAAVAEGRRHESPTGAGPRSAAPGPDAATSTGAAAADGTAPLPVRRPWRDPLPAVLPLDLVPPVSDGVAFGLVDVPEEQRQEPAVWRPQLDGHLMIVGATRSGRSTALRAIGARTPRSVAVPTGAEGAWDLIDEALSAVEAPDTTPSAGTRPFGSTTVLLLDDLDQLIDRFDGEHRTELLDRLLRLIREGPRQGIVLVIALRTVGSALHGVAAACGVRLVLRTADRAEHVIAGGVGAHFDPRMPSGGGFWHGHRVQVGEQAAGEQGGSRQPGGSSRHRTGDAAPTIRFAPGGVTLVVSSSPREFTMALAAAEDRPAVELVELTGRAVGPELISGRPGVHVVVVGDVDAWQAMWGLLPALRGRARLLFHRVGVADFRSISRSRRMPPALASPRHAWVVDLDDSVRRVALPHPHRATARSP